MLWHVGSPVLTFRTSWSSKISWGNLISSSLLLLNFLNNFGLNFVRLDYLGSFLGKLFGVGFSSLNVSFNLERRSISLDFLGSSVGLSLFLVDQILLLWAQFSSGSLGLGFFGLLFFWQVLHFLCFLSFSCIFLSLGSGSGLVSCISGGNSSLGSLLSSSSFSFSLISSLGLHDDFFILSNLLSNLDSNSSLLGLLWSWSWCLSFI